MSETKGHDPLCPLGTKDTTYQSWGFVECRCDEYAKVRADERAKAEYGHACWDGCVQQEAIRADLRAKVEGLRLAGFVTGDPSGDLLRRTEVLALLEEKS